MLTHNGNQVLKAILVRAEPFFNKNKFSELKVLPVTECSFKYLPTLNFNSFSDSNAGVLFR